MDTSRIPHNPPISHLLLGGGGLSGFEMLGVLHGLQWRGQAAAIRHVSSISIGTYFGAFFMMDVDAMVACRLLINCLTKKDALHISPLAIFKLPYTYHLVNIAPFMEPLRTAMRTKWPDVLEPESMTLADFCSRCHRDWSIIMTDLAASRPVVAAGSSSEFSDVAVLDLVAASMALPFILRPVCIKGVNYVDGGLTCDNPWIAFQGREPPLAKDVLQVVIAKQAREGVVRGAGKPHTVASNIGHFIQQLMECGMWHKSAFMMHGTAHVIRLREPVMPLLPLRITKQGLWIDITPEKIEAALMHGLDLFEAWYLDLLV